MPKTIGETLYNWWWDGVAEELAREHRRYKGLPEHTRYRADGWPLCPCCGNDEVYSLLHPTEATAPLQDYIDAGMACYQCSFTLEARTSHE